MSSNPVNPTTILYHCRAKAKTTGKQCRNTTSGDVCKVHTKSEREFPVVQVESIPASVQPKQEYPVSIEETKYKGNPVFSIRQGKFVLSFGLTKARAILEHIDVIRQFVAGQPIETSTQIRLSEFNGHPVLNLHNSDGNYVFSAGVTKYNQILDNLSALQKWYVYNLAYASPEPESFVVTKESLKATGLSQEQANVLFSLLGNNK